MTAVPPAVLVYEKRWAAPFASAVRRREGAQLVASGRIPVHAMAALDAAS